ncbi:hypothetical protein ACF5WF_003980, partial [Escherichia coli]
EDGEEKAVCIGLPHKVHTVPVVSVRLRVALYFVNIFPQGNKSFYSSSSHNRAIFEQWQTLANRCKSMHYIAVTLSTFTYIFPHN